ncbi:hypothetical protein [Streptacidiphilus monticola]|uniref:Uncharacterized protein n=1 Tax=Streptacidiphilus monticola TaxID=2161674 RepID=A0ABW1G3E2_9ACTN
MATDEDVVGRTGVLLVGTRGQAGPGEVQLGVRGGTECFLAYSEEPLPRGARVLVVESRGARSVLVVEWTDPLDELDALTGGAGDAG